MFFNWLTESIKWKILIKNIEKLSIKKSFQSVFAGLSFAIITPNRIGEFIGRPILLKKENRVAGGLSTFVGSLSQTIITVCLGLFALVLYFHNSSNKFLSYTQYYGLVFFSIFIFIIISILFFKPKFWIYLSFKITFFKKNSEKFAFLNNYSSFLLLKVLILSLSRYIIFFIQFYLLLIFFGIDISIQNAFIGIALNYLFLFAIPSFALVEIGIRVSFAVFFIGIYSTNNFAILMASISLWIINLAIPAIIGSLYVIKVSKKKKY